MTKKEAKEIAEEVTIVFNALVWLQEDYKRANSKALCRRLEKLLDELDKIQSLTTLPPKLDSRISDTIGEYSPWEDK